MSLFCDGPQDAWYDEWQRDDLPPFLLNAIDKARNGAFSTATNFEKSVSGDRSSLKVLQSEGLSGKGITGDKISTNGNAHNCFLLFRSHEQTAFFYSVCWTDCKSSPEAGCISEFWPLGGEPGACFDRLSTNGKFPIKFRPSPVHPELVEGRTAS